MGRWCDGNNVSEDAMSCESDLVDELIARANDMVNGSEAPTVEAASPVQHASLRRSKILVDRVESHMRAYPMSMMDPLCLAALFTWIATGERIVTPPEVATARNEVLVYYLRGGGKCSTTFMHILEADTTP